MVTMHPTILLIENDDEYAQYLKENLMDNNYNVVSYKSGVKSLDKIESRSIDIIISSYYLPNIRGEEFYQKVREFYPTVPIIFLSHESHKNIIKKILKYPNAEYMVKPIVLTELLARIEIALEENRRTSGKDKLKVGDLELDLNNFIATRNNTDIKLSPTEFSLLRYLMVNAGRVLTRGMILNRVWDYDTEVSSRVVDVYMGYLRNKVDKNHNTKLIKTVRGFGYTIED